MARFVKILSDRGFHSYFSCNPANINMERMVAMMANGLDYIKYSIESVDDERFKDIRGQASNFTESFAKIKELLEIRRESGYQTTFVITMLDLNSPNQAEE